MEKSSTPSPASASPAAAENVGAPGFTWAGTDADWTDEQLLRFKARRGPDGRRIVAMTPLHIPASDAGAAT